METRLCEELLKQRGQIGDSHRYLATVLGDIEKLTLPTREEIEERVRNLVKGTGVQTREVPLTIEAAQSSFDKVLHKLQPSDKGEQFADGVIWANCLELLQESDVWLVSGDKAFFKDYVYHNGLAPNLAEEAGRSPNQLNLFSDLEALRQGPSQDVHRVWPGDEPD